MLKTHHSLALFFLLTISNVSLGISALTQHTLSVSQSMSAFYMYSLTDGDTQYKDDYQRYLVEAEQHLQAFQKQDSVSAFELKNQWDKFRAHLQFEYVEGAGFIIPVSLRMQYRAYLNTLYGKIVALSNSETNLTEQVALMSLSVEVMSARFFDIASALYGTLSISNKDVVIDAPKMALKFNARLKAMQKLPASAKVKKNLKAVARKWAFIEDSVTNYKGEAAYLLVYYNKQKISRLLNKSRDMMAGT